MRLLLDTHVALALLRGSLARQYPAVARRLADPNSLGFVSVVALWETAIKTRLGKLDPGMPLSDIAGSLEALGLSILPIETRHVVASADPEPDTRDPFDRLLLAQCQVEGLKLVTVDAILRPHPLAVDLRGRDATGSARR